MTLRLGVEVSVVANSLNPDQAWQSVAPDMDPNRLTLWKFSELWPIFDLGFG